MRIGVALTSRVAGSVHLPRSSYRPVVAELEPRLVLSRPAVAAELAPIGTVVAAPGNLSLSLDDWWSLHDEYNARASRGTDVVFLGDSITYFWGDPARAPRNDPIPSGGLDLWTARFAPRGAANFGIMGDQTSNVLWRVQNGELKGRPKVAVLMVGVNDLAHGRSVEQTAEGVAAVVRAIRVASPSTRVLLLGLLPVNSDRHGPINARVNQVNARIARLGRAFDVKYMDVGKSFRERDGLVSARGFYDDLHPNALGYQRIADAIERPLRTMLGEGRRMIARVDSIR